MTGIHLSSVSEIKGAPCTWRAHFRGRVHDFRRCARFLSHLLLLYVGRVHGAISGCTVLWEVHPASAQNKSLISDTDHACQNSADPRNSAVFDFPRAIFVIRPDPRRIIFPLGGWGVYGIFCGISS